MNKRQIVLSLLLLISVVLPAQHGLDDFEKYRNYLKEPNAENFLSAVQHYESLADEGYINRVLLANMYLSEFDKNLEKLEENYDSLTVHHKFSLANLLLAVGRYERCLEIYEQLTSDYPKWSCPWRHKGEALFKTNQLEAALAATIQAIETREDHYDAYIQLAEIQKEMADYQGALQSLEKALLYQESYTEDEISEEYVGNLKKELEYLLGK